MNLVSPITVTRPGYTRRHDQVEVPPTPVTGDKLGITIIDDVVRRTAQVRLAFVREIRGKEQAFMQFPKSLELWKDEAYDAAGDYTQQMVEDRILEALGSDIKAGLESLFNR